MWTFIFGVVIAGMIFSAWKSKHLADHGAYEDDSGTVKTFENSSRERELQREIEELRERVKVLERIATDGNDTKRLSDEIEKLRDN
jgi:uncharacterized protein YlxW (UPF0749 family)